MAIMVFKKTLTLQEAEALTKLAKGAIFNSHHNWERNVRSTFDSSNPSLEVRQVAHIISEFIRKPAYCFIFAHGKDVESSFIRIKDADDFLGVVSEKM